MSELSSVGDSYDSLLIDLRSGIAEAKREWSAGLLCAYPGRTDLKLLAHDVRGRLGSLAVEVNAIYNDRQITIASAPTGEEPEVSVPMHDSLCVLTVGLAKPLRLTDAGDGFVGPAHVLYDRGLGSWASVPIMIEGEAAGTVCAVEIHARDWTDRDHEVLEQAAREIQTSVETWLEEN